MDELKTSTINIASDLLKNEYFCDFKLRKKDYSLIRKTQYGYEKVCLVPHHGYDPKRAQTALEIQPFYYKRFNILHRWFEKYSFKSTADQRDSYSIGFSSDMLGNRDTYYFLYKGEDYQVDYPLFEKQVLENAKYVFQKYATLEDIYQEYVSPIFEESYELPNVGADWVFEYLTLTKLVEPTKFDQVRQILEQRVNEMNARGEPNIAYYHPLFNDIVEYLDSQELLN